MEVSDKDSCSHSTQSEKNYAPICFVLEDSDHKGYKPDNSVDTRVEDQDIDSEHTIEVLAEQHKDFVVECNHGLVFDYKPTEIGGDK